MAKKPETTFSVVFKGGDIYPESIPLRKVFDAVKAVQQLAKLDVGDGDEDQSVRLIGVARGSAAFRCYARDEDSARDNLRQAGMMLDRGRLVPDAGFAIRPIDELSRLARSLGCTIRIERDRTDVLATIQGDSYDKLVGSSLISGETTITGEVKRVGGATGRRCMLRLPSRLELLYCDVASEQVARELGNHLYEDVVASGTAQWLKLNWEIVGFRIASVTTVAQGSLSEAFGALRAAGGDAWDHVDKPGALLAEIRGE